MSSQELIIEGARQNNLRNITLRIPHNREEKETDYFLENKPQGTAGPRSAIEKR